MVDQLITVDSDRGPIEPMPVTPFFNGQAVDLTPIGNPPHLTAKIPSSAAGTNRTLAKSTPGYGYKIFGYNTNAAARYLKIYNIATLPVIGTDVPTQTLYLDPVDPFEFELDGYYYSAGIAFAFTTGAPDADTGAIASGDIMCFNLLYA